MRRIAVRKIVRVRRVASVLKRIAIADFVFASSGIVLYLTLLPYEVVLVDAFLWVLEALLFAGIIATLNVITSKTLYGARYELLRGESLASLFVAVVATALTTQMLASKVSALINYSHLSTSHPLSATYIFAGAAVSALIYRWCRNLTRVTKVKALIANTLARKQLLDAVIDAVLGTSVLLANLTSKPLIEAVGIILVTAYVLKGYFEIMKDDILRLIGTYEPAGIRRKIIKAARTAGGLRIRKILITSLGSFVEAEVWVEAPPTTTLDKAHETAMKIARAIVADVPEVVRALVIVVPSEGRMRIKVMQNNYNLSHRIFRQNLLTIERTNKSQ